MNKSLFVISNNVKKLYDFNINKNINCLKNADISYYNENETFYMMKNIRRVVVVKVNHNNIANIKKDAINNNMYNIKYFNDIQEAMLFGDYNDASLYELTRKHKNILDRKMIKSKEKRKSLSMYIFDNDAEYHRLMRRRKIRKKERIKKKKQHIVTNLKYNLIGGNM